MGRSGAYDCTLSSRIFILAPLFCLLFITHVIFFIVDMACKSMICIRRCQPNGFYNQPDNLLSLTLSITFVFSLKYKSFIIVYIDSICTSCLKREDMKSSFYQFFLIFSYIFYRKYKILENF